MLDRALARRIKAVGLDVDGVLTDGGVYIGLVAHTPIEFKRFDIQDGLGVKLLRAAGLPVILVSGRPSEASEARAAELQVDELLQVPPETKLAALEQAMGRRGLTVDACAYVGDDLADVPVLRAVALPIAVANAAPEVKAVARSVTSKPGGHGAVRQVAELLLQARGEWTALVERYLEAADVTRTGDRAR